jgi:NADPH:quinone reductase-like Zn-dependent oxidoreductase
MTLGQDFAGVVAKVVPGTLLDGRELKEGTPVFGEAWGTFAELISVPSHDLVEKPAAIDFVTAAALPMPALTAWQVACVAEAAPGRRILVHGGAGGVGSFAAQFSRLKGARVTVTSGPESFAYLRDAGIADIVDYHREPFERRGRVFDVVIDPFGGELQQRSFEVLAPGGLLINLVGAADEAGANEAGVRAIDFEMHYDTGDLREIAGLVGRGEVKPHISCVMPLEAARDAMEMNQRGESHGKIVLALAAHA